MLTRALPVVLSLLCSLPSAAELTIDPTPERLARGKYLLTAVLGCSGCHTERAMKLYGFPPKKSMYMAGGFNFRLFGDKAYSPNITPFALAGWSDQEIYDAITRGVRPDGRTLHGLMPYRLFGALDPEEIYAVIVALRALDSIEAGPYPREFIGDPAPTPPGPSRTQRPADSAPMETQGEYLVTIANCNFCHTGGEDLPVAGTPFAGGREFEIPGRGLIRAANLTPDLATGIGAWTREAFLARFRSMRGSEEQPAEGTDPKTVMHWWSFAYMTDGDLGAIYAYLRTLEPASNLVIRYEPLGGDPLIPNWSGRE